MSKQSQGVGGRGQDPRGRCQGSRGGARIPSGRIRMRGCPVGVPGRANDSQVGVARTPAARTPGPRSSRPSPAPSPRRASETRSRAAPTASCSCSAPAPSAPASWPAAAAAAALPRPPPRSLRPLEQEEPPGPDGRLPRNLNRPAAPDRLRWCPSLQPTRTGPQGLELARCIYLRGLWGPGTAPPPLRWGCCDSGKPVGADWASGSCSTTQFTMGGKAGFCATVTQTAQPSPQCSREHPQRQQGPGLGPDPLCGCGGCLGTE